jgi:hypothetical protein
MRCPADLTHEWYRSMAVGLLRGVRLADLLSWQMPA